MLGVRNPPHPVRRCCPTGQSLRSLLGPGHFYGREEVTGGKRPRILAPVHTPDTLPGVLLGTACSDLISSSYSCSTNTPRGFVMLKTGGQAIRRAIALRQALLPLPERDETGP